MNSKEAIELISDMDTECLKLINTKSNDYADSDILKNFKSVSTACKALEIDVSKGEQYALLMVLLKIARLTNLINSEKGTKNESIRDSFLDAINYLKLAFLAHIDNTDSENHF